MVKLPVVSGLHLIKVLIKKGFIWTNTTGSHVTLVDQGPPKIVVTVPLHKELRPGLLNSILKKTNTSRDEV